MENGRFTHWMRAAVALLLGLASLCALLACGGGGGSGPGNAATLTWTHSASEAVHGYRVYFGPSSRTYVQARGAGVNASYTDRYVVTGLTPGTTYYFAVTAYGTGGLESDYSNEISARID